MYNIEQSWPKQNIIPEPMVITSLYHQEQQLTQWSQGKQDCYSQIEITKNEMIKLNSVINSQICLPETALISLVMDIRIIYIACCYNVVNFLPNSHKIHPLAHPLGWALGCILWVKTLIHTLLQSLQWYIHPWAKVLRLFLCVYFFATYFHFND